MIHMPSKSKTETCNSTSGFTIIEILVAIALLAILSLAISSTLIGSLSLNGQNQRRLDSTTGTQQVIENIRGAWLVKANYDRACVDNLTLPSTTYITTYTDLDARAMPLAGSTATDIVRGSTASPVAPCAAKALRPSTGTVPVMRRVVVSSGTGDQATTLSLDILGPQ